MTLQDLLEYDRVDAFSRESRGYMGYTLRWYMDQTQTSLDQSMALLDRVGHTLPEGRKKSLENHISQLRSELEPKYIFAKFIFAVYTAEEKSFIYESEETA